MDLFDLTEEDVLRFLKLDREECDIPPRALLSAAMEYIRGVTGLSEDEMRGYSDLAAAALVLCADLYENRQTTVEAGHKNMVVDTILGMHRVNLV